MFPGLKWKRSVHPLARDFFSTMPDGSRVPVAYYWTAPQSEWASDVMFTSREDLLPLYERLVRHGITSYGPGDVLRFFGRRVKADERLLEARAAGDCPAPLKQIVASLCRPGRNASPPPSPANSPCSVRTA